MTKEQDKKIYKGSFYPRIYTYSGWRKFSLCIVGIFTMFMGGFLFFVASVSEQNKDVSDTISVIAAATLLTFMSLYLIIRLFKLKIILYKDKIEIYNVFSMKDIHRLDISGYRNTTGKYGSNLIIVPRDKNRKKLRLDLSLDTDDAFYDWFTPLKDLDSTRSKTRFRKRII